MADELSQVLEDLVATQEALDRLPADAFGERAELHQRQEELRARARDLRQEAHYGMTREQLEERIDRLEDRIEKRIGTAASATSGLGLGDGLPARDAQSLEDRMDEAVHLDDLQEELRVLRNRLAEFDEN